MTVPRVKVGGVGVAAAGEGLTAGFAVGLAGVVEGGAERLRSSALAM